MAANYYQGSSTGLKEILESDDKEHFVSWLRDHPIDLDIINSLGNECVELAALKCLVVLIRGEVCNMHPTFNAGNLPDSGVTALACVAHSCPDDHQSINLILTKCGGTCLTNVYCTIGVVHGLPIHFLLINLSLMEHLYYWYRGSSVIKLVILLCLWETKPILESLRMLVEYTDSINCIAWTVLKNGGLKQFTALLLVAREKLIAPFDTGLTISHYIETEIDSIIGDKLSIEQEEYKCILKDAQTLLHLFEVIGDDLSSYCSSMQKCVSKDDVVDDIIKLLVKHQVCYGGSDINLIDCCDEGYLGRAWSDSSPWMSLDFKVKYTTVEALPPSYSDHYYLQSQVPFCGESVPIPNFVQRRLYTTGACQAGMMSKSIPHISASPLPRHLGFIARKFINRVRFL